jgi:hypothetical protein
VIWRINPKLAYATAAVLLVVAFFPVPCGVAPDWTVTTLDASHRPLSGITVREVWQQYSLESISHEEDLLTDSRDEFTSLGDSGGAALRAAFSAVYDRSLALELKPVAALMPISWLLEMESIRWIGKTLDKRKGYQCRGKAPLWS